MTWVVVLWSCTSLTCTHPDAHWSGREYGSRYGASIASETQVVEFQRANPTREVVKFEVMSRERWEWERGNYHCGRSGE